MIITITGPRSVGKTTVSKLVARKLKLRYVSSDELGEKALKKQGGLDKAIKSGAIMEFVRKKGYSLITKEYKRNNFVYDLSIGSVTSEDFPKASKEVRDTANERGIVIGLLPSKNSKDSIRLLFNRELRRKHFKNVDKKELLERIKKRYPKVTKRFKKFPDFVVYTKGKKPREIAEEIVSALKTEVEIKKAKRLDRMWKR
ncbi:hypothetical protein CMI45_02780 [Candidatus Pacearchaeota archaeon]|nr:hypothetical protein [Candidatus Pacearchaeota archaeon]|tara:strand:+ start:8180 stop:8779 length:600 start_codon:yes stop_codon:yes gene_type:complete